jgi:hypothetical protein
MDVLVGMRGIRRMLGLRRRGRLLWRIECDGIQLVWMDHLSGTFKDG